MSLLPGRRLAFISLHNISVYDIGTMVDDRPTTAVISQLPSQSRWALSDGAGNFSFYHRQSSLDTKAVTLVLTSKQMIYQLVIPHNVDYTPHLIHRAKVPQEFHIYTAGREKALGKKDKSVLVKIGMARDSEQETTGSEVIISQIPDISLWSGPSPPPILAEDIGRIVIQKRCRIDILDACRFPVM